MDEIRLIMILIVAVIIGIFCIGITLAMCRVNKKEEPKKNSSNKKPIRSLCDIDTKNRRKITVLHPGTGLIFNVTFNTMTDSTGIAIYVHPQNFPGMKTERLMLAEFTDGRFVQI